MNELGFSPFHTRTHEFIGLQLVGGCQLKVYSVRFDAQPPAAERFADGLARAAATLPAPDLDSGRPGVGFAICHQGNTSDYLVVGCWDQENELPLQVYLRDGSGWRVARARESFCVWDLEIIWFERNAYVETVLAPHGASCEAYLQRRFSSA